MTVRLGVYGLLVLAAITTDLSAQRGESGEATAVRRTGSIAGRIIHANGAAAAGARVAVYAVREGAAAAIVGITTASYDGRYEVTGLPPGLFIVSALAQTAAGFGGDLEREPAFPIETFYPGVRERENGQPIYVFENLPTEGIDVWLEPAPQRFSISGRVFWPEGVEVERIVIEYGGPEAIRHGVWYVNDPGGLFTIEGIGQESYVLLARADTATGPLIGLASTDVAFGPVEDVRIALRRPGRIEGRIVVEGVGGMLPTSLHVSPVQALLSLSPLYPVERALVGADGRFEIVHVSGEYRLEVDGLPPDWRVKRIVRDEADLPDGRVVVAPGEHVTAVEIVIGTGST